MASINTPKKCCGIFTRRERWGLSARGWLALALFFCATAIFLLLNVQPFLSKTRRVNTNILVVEGWIHEYATRAAVAEFQNGHYKIVFTTGGPIVGTDGDVNDFNTSASVGAELLEKYGAPKSLVQPVPSHIAGRDRTYNSALALRDWLRGHSFSVRSVNILTEDVHARRTQLLFKKALGRSVAVGIISVRDPDYDARRWWRYSEGVRAVLGEGIAYIYARVFFHPANG